MRKIRLRHLPSLAEAEYDAEMAKQLIATGKWKPIAKVVSAPTAKGKGAYTPPQTTP